MTNFNLKDFLKNKRGFTDKDLSSISNNSISRSQYLTNANKAIARIKKAIENNEYIYHSGDYDVDGITSNYILTTSISYLYSKAGNDKTLLTHTPEKSEGYGMSLEWVKTLDLNKKGLVLTTDNGITCHEAIKYLYDNGFDVIIIDHHLPDENINEILKMSIVVDPHVFESDPQTYLCGGSLTQKIFMDLFISMNIPNPFLYQHLCCAGLATICDMMDLSYPENIAYVKMLHEFSRNEKHCPMFIRTYLDYKGVRQLDYKEMNWGLGPILNSANRTGTVKDAVSFVLCENNPDMSLDLFYKLSKYNDTKKNEKKKYIKKIQTSSVCTDLACIDIHDTKYPGMLGLYAQEALKYYSSVVVSIALRNEEDGYSYGSARCSIPFKPFLDELTQFDLSASGHDESFGFSIKTEQIESFTKYLNEILIPNILEMSLDEINDNESSDNKNFDYELESIKDFKQIYESFNFPYGQKLDPPTFYIDKLVIAKIAATKTNPNNCFVSFIDGNNKLFKQFLSDYRNYDLREGKYHKVLFTIEPNFIPNGPKFILGIKNIQYNE